ncbi:tyrosine-type recombinase/integrase [Mesorhizobium sp. M1227]
MHFEEPAHSAQIQRVLAIPSKRCDKRQLQFLTRPEIEAILACPDRSTWLGRRDYTLLLLAAQTGLRVSEIIDLDRDSVMLGHGAHVRCLGKGRKERSTPAHQGCTASPSGLAQRAQEAGRNGSLSEHARRQTERRRRAGAAEQICRQGSRTLRHPPLEAGVAPCFEAQRCHGAAAVDCSVIALWLGHEAMETTLTYLHAHLGLKESALAKLKPYERAKAERFRPNDRLLEFLNAL